jgi:hypothetical protein
MAGEPLFDGSIAVELDGSAPPPGTVVDVNGVPLARESLPGASNKFWRVDPALSQPPLRTDGTVTITARSGSLVRSITLACPRDVAVSSSTPVGTRLSPATSLSLRWGTDLSVNAANPLDTDFYASANLRGLDLATYTVSPGALAQQLVPQHAVQTTLPVVRTKSSGYVVDLRWQGPFVLDGTSEGFCGRVKRLVFRR